MVSILVCVDCPFLRLSPIWGQIKKATKSQLLEMCVITGTLDRAILISQENAASQAMHSSRLRISTPTSTSAFVERSPTASSNTGAHSATSNAAISTSSFNDSSTTTSMGLPTATPSFPLWLEHQSSDKSFLELLADDISRPPQNF
ncbi:hypothetical protein FOL47_009583 [Perkinsus chesapeaki]|uniref:Uncharacterized protein n=1 Tax=Perkinsus chesapeaki TaxID=330153 RepID=A0A7J6MS91_PERCH|nr:hypothetical protein FOL47_009583 [Perkinsus chesapeaki]